jgi:hypothetical protein
MNNSEAGRPGFDSDKGRYVSLIHSLQSGSGAHPQWIQRAISPEVKRPTREADHSSPSSAEVKNGGAIPPLSLMSSWRGV